MSSLDQVANFIKVTVNQGYGTTDTAIQLATGQGAKLPNPASGAYNLVYWNSTDYVDPADDPNVEIVRATAISGFTNPSAAGTTTVNNVVTIGFRPKLIVGNCEGGNGGGTTGTSSFFSANELAQQCLIARCQA